MQTKVRRLAKAKAQRLLYRLPTDLQTCSVMHYEGLPSQTEVIEVAYSWNVAILKVCAHVYISVCLSVILGVRMALLWMDPDQPVQAEGVPSVSICKMYVRHVLSTVRMFMPSWPFHSTHVRHFKRHHLLNSILNVFPAVSAQ